MNSIEQRLQRAALLASGIDAFGTGSFVSAAAVIFFFHIIMFLQALLVLD